MLLLRWATFWDLYALFILNCVESTLDSYHVLVWRLAWCWWCHPWLQFWWPSIKGMLSHIVLYSKLVTLIYCCHCLSWYRLNLPMAGEDHHHMIVTAVMAMEVVVVDFQSIQTTGVCLHESCIILLSYTVCSVELLDDMRYAVSSFDWLLC